MSDYEYSIEDENLPLSHCPDCDSRLVVRSEDDGSSFWLWCENCDKQIKE